MIPFALFYGLPMCLMFSIWDILIIDFYVFKPIPLQMNRPHSTLCDLNEYDNKLGKPQEFAIKGCK